MAFVQRFQSSTAGQLNALPNCPERNLWLAQSGKVQRMPALRGGHSFHGTKMLLKQLHDLRALKVVYTNLQTAHPVGVWC